MNSCSPFGQVPTTSGRKMACGRCWCGCPWWRPGSRAWSRSSENTGPSLDATTSAGNCAGRCGVEQQFSCSHVGPSPIDYAADVPIMIWRGSVSFKRFRLFGQPQNHICLLCPTPPAQTHLLSSRFVTHSYFKLSLVRGSETRLGVKVPSCWRFPSSHRDFPNLMCIFHNVQKGQKYRRAHRQEPLKVHKTRPHVTQWKKNN